jgi:hypothetical protein
MFSANIGARLLGPASEALTSQKTTKEANIVILGKLALENCP